MMVEYTTSGTYAAQFGGMEKESLLLHYFLTLLKELFMVELSMWICLWNLIGLMFPRQVSKDSDI